MFQESVITINLFNFDSPFYKALSKLADMVIISLLWLATCLPVITIGAATTAAYYVMTRRISDMESNLLKDYFTEFKRSFKKSTVIFLIIAFFGLINIYNIFFVELPGMLRTATLVLQALLALEFIFMFLHVFPLISRFDMSIKRLLMLSLMLANKHFLVTLALVGLLALIILFCLLFPGLVFFAFGVYCWFSSRLLVWMYRKYLPNMDTNPDIK